MKKIVLFLIVLLLNIVFVEAATVEFTVDSGGQAISGAVVSLTGVSDPSFNQLAVTSSDGKASFSSVPEWAGYMYLVVKDGYVSKDDIIFIEADKQIQVSLDAQSDDLWPDNFYEFDDNIEIILKPLDEDRLYNASDRFNYELKIRNKRASGNIVFDDTTLIWQKVFYENGTVAGLEINTSDALDTGDVIELKPGGYIRSTLNGDQGEFCARNAKATINGMSYEFSGDEYICQQVVTNENIIPYSFTNGSYYIKDYVEYNYDGKKNISLQTTNFFIGNSGAGVNHEPVLSVINFTINETDTINLNYYYSATDPDGDNITTTISGWMTGDSYTTTYDDSGVHNVTIKVSDGEFEVSKDITIIVLNVNRAPVLSSTGDKQVNENSTLEFAISATDPDGDSLSYSAFNLPSGASLNTATGAFSWMPDFDQGGAYQVTFNVSDGNLSDSETITIIVNNTNRAPFISSDPATNTKINRSYFYIINSTDPDGDNLSYSLTLAPQGMTINSNVISWTPEQQGQFNVNITVSDGSLTVKQTFTLTVEDNNAPVLEYINNITANENDLISITASASDAEEDSLTYSINDSRFSQNNNIFTWQTDYGDSGTYLIKITVDDGYGGSDSQDVMIIVNNLNRAPSIEPIDNIVIDENESVQITVNATDPDGDTLQYSINYSKFSQNNNIFTWQTDCDDSGVYNVKIIVSDGELESYQIITITVNNELIVDMDGDGYTNEVDCDDYNSTIYPGATEILDDVDQNCVNDVPIVDSINPSAQNISVENGLSVQFSVKAYDYDGDNLIYSWSLDNKAVSVSKRYEYRAQLGAHSVKLVISDGKTNIDYNWSINAIDPYIEMKSSNFSEIEDLSSATNIFFEKNNVGKINFGGTPLNLSNTVEISKYIEIDNGRIAIDTDHLSAFANKPAEITMYDLKFDDKPIIYKNGKECDRDFCTNIRYNKRTGKLTFDVKHFTTFEVFERDQKIFIDSIATDDYLRAGEFLNVNLHIDKEKAKLTKISVILPELGVRGYATMGKYDAEAKISVQIPYWASPGEYAVRISISDKDITRIVYRSVVVI